MVSKKYNESDVRVMFQSFGTIEECTVLRDTNGISKGNINFSVRNEIFNDKKYICRFKINCVNDNVVYSFQNWYFLNL